MKNSSIPTFISFMRLSIAIFKLSIFFNFLLLSACSEENNSEKFNELLEDKFSFKNRCKPVLFLSNNGCPACNYKFAKYIGNLSHNKFNVVVSNRGNSLDLSSLNNTNADIYFDYQSLLETEQIVDVGSAFIGMKNCKLDTIIQINLKNFDESISYIESHYHD